MGLPGIEWVVLRDHSGGSMQVRTLRRRYSSSRSPLGPSLEAADFIVEAFAESERDLVFQFTVGGDTVPVAIDHVGEARFCITNQRAAQSLVGLNRSFQQLARIE
jgi:hypothetical protein